MPTLTLLQPPDWTPPKGYANGIAVSAEPGARWLFVGGQIGWNARQIFDSDDFIDQCRQALRNVCAVLACAGAGPEHIVRMTWYLTDREEYVRRLPELGAVYRQVIGRHYPAMSAVEVSALVEPRALVEIEVTAIAPPASAAASTPD